MPLNFYANIMKLMQVTVSADTNVWVEGEPDLWTRELLHWWNK